MFTLSLYGGFVIVSPITRSSLFFSFWPSLCLSFHWLSLKTPHIFLCRCVHLVSDAEKPLSDGCTKSTKLFVILHNLKVGNEWSNKSLIHLLTLLNDILPKDNVLHSQTYGQTNFMFYWHELWEDTCLF